MSLSRYRNINILQDDNGKRHYATMKFPTKKQLDTIPSFKIRLSQFDRLDQLAAKHLGDGTLWWILAMMNDIDWAYKFNAGDIIKVPINVDDVLKLV